MHRSSFGNAVLPYRSNRICRMPLLHSQCMFSSANSLGKVDLLAVGRLAALGGELQPIVGQLQRDVLLLTPGISTKTSTWSSSSWMSTSGSRTSSPCGALRGTAADVAERLDLEFLLAVFAQRGLDIDAVDAADFSAGVLEFAGSGEFLAGFGQLAQFFDESAQPAEQPAQLEGERRIPARAGRVVLFVVVYACHCVPFFV